MFGLGLRGASAFCTFPIFHNGQTRRGASAFRGRFRVCICDHVHFPHLRGVRLGPSGLLTRAMCARVPSPKSLTMSVSVLYSECVLGLSPARPAWFLRLALSRPVRAPPPPPRAVLCADRVPIVRRYPSSQEYARVRKQLPGAAALGGGPARGWVTGTGRRLPRAREAWAWAGAAGGGTTVRKGGARAAAAAPRRPALSSVRPSATLAFPPLDTRAPFIVRNQKPSAAPGAPSAPPPLPGPRPRPPRDDRDRSPPARPLAPAGFRPQNLW